jgi:hypothetical protein
VADQAVIDAVLLDLADEAVELGFDSTIIGTMLDAGVTQTKVTLAGWYAIAGKMTTDLDISESGSSRSFGSLFDKARQMIEVWQKKADAEDDLTNSDSTGKARARIHTAVRV